MRWRPTYELEGLRVERVKGKNKGWRGHITKVFSVSGTFHVRYDKGTLGKFCGPKDFMGLSRQKIVLTYR